MRKLKMATPDLTQANIERIAQLFPNVITEAKDESGALKQFIDFDLLKQELSGEIVAGDKERYQLTWPGKKEAILLANQPVYKTLRPVRDDSVNWDTTENLYIEGDNLQVLKLLQESYLNKVKCIYIDPPYNTGKDFIYKDNFKQDINEYLQESGQLDENGNRLFQNTDTNGRFHSDWLSMMYPRLKLARNLLRDDGVIFISIDDGEVHNLRKICDEIMGVKNFIGNIVWQKKQSPQNDATNLSDMHDHIIVYAKRLRENKNDSQGWKRNLLPRTKDQVNRYQNPDNDKRGPWTSVDLTSNKTSNERPNLYYSIKNPYTHEEIWPSSQRVWRYEKATMENLLIEQRICWGDNGDNFPRQKRFLNEVQEGLVPSTWWDRGFASDNQAARRELRAIFKEDEGDFNTPKPTLLIKKILQISSNNNNQDIVLDFFSGSATTAHAVIQLNTEDGGNRKYIMVQLPEKCDENSDAHKAGFYNICEIGKERIRRASQKIKDETSANIDYGFRVFRLDTTNMKDVYYSPNQLKPGVLKFLESNIKEDRTGEDLLIQVMLDLGLELSLPMETKKLYGKQVHFVAGNSLTACFDENIPEKLVRKLANEKPLKVVFRDSSFKDDASRINVEEIFKMLSPGTDVKVI